MTVMRMEIGWRDAAPTIVDVLEGWATRESDSIAYTLVEDVDTEETSLSFKSLDMRARAVASALCGVGSKGDHVLLHFHTSLDFVAALFGCLYAGMVGVPVYPLDPARLERTMGRMLSVVRDSGATLGLTTRASGKLLTGLTATYPELARLRWLDTYDVGDRQVGRWSRPALKPSDAAILQYTSGSTSSPKGVVLTHDNILSNERMIQREQAYSSGNTFVAWIPLAHDWGLIGSVLQPMYSGARSVLMPTECFLRSPSTWLRLISRYTKVMSGGPNFAYDLCSRKISPDQRARLDLSGWIRAAVGAGRVSAATLERFAAVFGPAGFRREAFYNGYGLAEATLSVSATSPRQFPTVLRLERDALERHDVRSDPPPKVPAVGLVGSGQPNRGLSVVVVDPESGTPCAADRVGEVWVSGPNVAQGYWSNPRASADTFGATLARFGTKAFLRTGDLGFLHRGELFITGRLKDLIIMRGRNLYPDDIERTVEGCHPALRPGGVAAFSEQGDADERLVVVQELRSPETADLGAVVETIRRAVLDAHDIVAHIVVLSRPRSVPKTSSGKTRRRECRNWYVAGQLDVVMESVMDIHTRKRELSERDAAATPTQSRVLAVWARLLRTEDIGIHDNFLDLGGESLLAQQCLSRLAQEFAVELPLELLLSEGGTVEGLADAIDRSLGVGA